MTELNVALNSNLETMNQVLSAPPRLHLSNLGARSFSFEGYKGEITQDKLTELFSQKYKEAVNPLRLSFDSFSSIFWNFLAPEPLSINEITHYKDVIETGEKIAKNIENLEIFTLQTVSNNFSPSCLLAKARMNLSSTFGTSWKQNLEDLSHYFATDKVTLKHRGIQTEEFSVLQSLKRIFNSDPSNEEDRKAEMFKLFEHFFGANFSQNFSNISSPQAENPYDVLGIPSTASASEIRTAYRNLARKHHPDKNPDDPHAAEKFIKIQAAYEMLDDEKLRRRYDAMRTN